MKAYLRAADIKKIMRCSMDNAHRYLDFVMNAEDKKGHRYIDSTEFKVRKSIDSRVKREVPANLFIEFFPSVREEVKSYGQKGA